MNKPKEGWFYLNIGFFPMEMEFDAKCERYIEKSAYDAVVKERDEALTLTDASLAAENTFLKKRSAKLVKAAQALIRNPGNPEAQTTLRELIDTDTESSK